MNYVGKPLSYVLATPERPDDADNPLRVAFGNEASDRDIEEFARRFDCTVIDGFGSTETPVVISRDPGTPPGSLGQGVGAVAVYDPETRDRVPVARSSTSTGALLNLDEAIGELVNTAGTGYFAGYYNDEAATDERMRDGMYWSGDLAYRDAEGLVYLRRPHRRLDAGGRREPRRRADRADPGAAPVGRPGRGVRRPGPARPATR